MDDDIQRLLDLATDLDRSGSLETMLDALARGTTRLVDAPRASVRVLDETGTKLLVAARFGEALHRGTSSGEFAVGEGLVGWVAQHAIRVRLASGEDDPRFVDRASREAMGSFLGIPLVTEGACIGVLASTHPTEGHFTPEHERLLVLATAMTAPRIQVARLRRISQTDSLTGVLNRRWLDEEFRAVRDRSTDGPLSIALFDIDHFKDLNDRCGHAVGDRVLSAFAGILAGAVRADDRVVRAGGDEFVAVLPYATLDHANRVAERVQAAVRDHCVVVGGVSVRFNVSAGVAQLQAGDSIEHGLLRADGALYCAKRGGRNRIAIAV